MLLIDSPDDPSLSDYCNLTDAASARSGFFIVEGVLAVQRLLERETGRMPSPIRSVLLTPNRAQTLTDMIALCEGLDIAVLVAGRDVLTQVTGFDVHRGVLAAVNRTEQPSLGSIMEGTQRLVILEAINDHENIGSIFRNAAALGIDAVLLDARTSDPFYRRSIRVSLGHVLSTPWTRVQNLNSALQQVREAGFKLVGLTPDAQAREVGTAAIQGTLDSPVAFVLGAEGPGLSAETLQLCDALVRIPMSDGVDSLNVATSLAVVASFAIARNGI
jgi:tRNA G18 (ribose-2'-O)-methylase SpoU